MTYLGTDSPLELLDAGVVRRRRAREKSRLVGSGCAVVDLLAEGLELGLGVSARAKRACATLRRLRVGGGSVAQCPLPPSPTLKARGRK